MHQSSTIIKSMQTMEHALGLCAMYLYYILITDRKQYDEGLLYLYTTPRNAKACHTKTFITPPKINGR